MMPCRALPPIPSCNRPLPGMFSGVREGVRLEPLHRRVAGSVRDGETKRFDREVLGE